MALVKYNNNSISAITTPGALATGAMVLIKEQTASSSSTISFVDGTSDVVLDNTYPIYKFEFINIHPSASADFLFQGNVDGASGYNETITSTFFTALHKENDATATLAYRTTYDQANGTAFQTLSYETGTDNDQSVSGYLQLFNPSDTTFVKHFIGECNNYHNFPRSEHCFVAGYFNVTGAINAIQFKMSSGNMDAGKIKLYGIKDS